MTHLDIPGCYLIAPNAFNDHRGTFVKTFNADDYLKEEIHFFAKEEFFSFSKKNVLRGLHFQEPPHAHNKLVYCPKGSVQDFFCDLRTSSPTYGKVMHVELSEHNHHVLYLPKGIAHGFLTLIDDSLMIYKTDAVYDQAHDAGILWRSVDLPLDVHADSIIISERDNAFPAFSDYESPFQ